MLEPRILDFFRTTAETRPGDALLAAVSGGPDSIALLHALLRVRDSLGVRVELAHLDHGTRGEESRGDAAFVADLARTEALTLHHRRIDVPALAAEGGGSLETVARRERYTFLEEARLMAGARWILTGHTADDQVETFLMNLLRGAGPRGMGGMLPVGPGPLCRPLLGSSRAEILEYLSGRQVAYREDSSNQDLAPTRNRIRHRLVPLLEEEFGPGAGRTLARASRLMNDLDAFLVEEANRRLEALVRPDPGDPPGTLRLEVEGLLAEPRAMQQLVLRTALESLAGGLEAVHLAHVEACLDLVQRPDGTGEAHLPHGLSARREYETLALAAREQVGLEAGPAPSPPLDLEQPGSVDWGGIRLSWTRVPNRDADLLPPGKPAQSVVFDGGGPVPPVYLRSVQQGDRLEPAGMDGSQKLSDLLINQKVPRRLRTWIPLLCDNGGPGSGERILWVVGQRHSRHAPVGSQTSQVLQFQAETIVQAPRGPRKE
jgi:tRNA(Ile)-lysidine synthase